MKSMEKKTGGNGFNKNFLSTPKYQKRKNHAAGHAGSHFRYFFRSHLLFGHSSCKGGPAGLHAVLFPSLGLDSLLRSCSGRKIFAK